MADDIVIRAEGLGKKYLIGHEAERERYVALRDVIARGARNAWRMAADMARGRVVVPGDTVEELWALRDINFEVRRGEVLGIIGRNGAGKSTLLKVLSRITEPTEGRVTIKGRVASLLEVGTGFHPELTGRENIYLNGAILGMSRAEIKHKFDEIVVFADVEQFLDTPVKRYSSGMYVRLAFAVAAHLEPEILVVDEVLSVGDAEFQKKSLGKMEKVAKTGRTVLFVSHNLAAVGRLCRQGILIERGRLALQDRTDRVISHYIRQGKNEGSAHVELAGYPDRSGDGSAKIVEAWLRDETGNATTRFQVGDSVFVEYRVVYSRPSANTSYSIELTNSNGVSIYHLWDIDSRVEGLSAVHERLVRACIRNIDLCPDDYSLTLWVGDTQGQRADRVVDCLSFSLEDTGSHTRRNLQKSKGLIPKLAEWSYSEAESTSDLIA